MRFILVLLLVLSGCRCDLKHRMDGQVYFKQQDPELYELYNVRDIKQLNRLLQADIWLLEQHHECHFLLTNKEAKVLTDRIRLVRSMISIIRAVD